MSGGSINAALSLINSGFSQSTIRYGFYDTVGQIPSAIANAPVPYPVPAAGQPNTNPTYASLFDPLTSTERGIVEGIFTNQLAHFVGVQFELSPDPTNSEIALGGLNHSATIGGFAVGGWASFPGATDGSAGDVWILTDARLATGNTFTYSYGFTGDYFYVVAPHELGHALGLKHTADVFGQGAPEDSQQYSIMSYLPGSDTAYGFQLYDIAALQKLYGRNTSFNNGATTYSDFYSIYGTTSDKLICIWDGGGDDTIDATAYDKGAFIDLRPGHFSTIGSHSNAQIANGTIVATGWENISIAFGADIENALGTSLADGILGNVFSNRIVGAAGNDVIYGDGDLAPGVLGGTTDYSIIDHSVTGRTPDASAQKDTLLGGAGDDFIVGSGGGDSLDGGSDNDTVEGGSGADTIEGGEGDDSLSGGNGDDSISGGAGADTISGGQGVDVLDADAGDLIIGDDANDILVSHAGNATLLGGAGDDIYDFRDAGTKEATVSFGIGSGHDALLVDYSLWPLNLYHTRNSYNFDLYPDEAFFPFFPYLPFGDHTLSENNVRFIDFGDLDVSDLKIELKNTELQAELIVSASEVRRWYGADIYVTIPSSGDSIFVGRTSGFVYFDNGNESATGFGFNSGNLIDGKFSGQQVTDVLLYIQEHGGLIWHAPGEGDSINGSSGGDTLSDGSGNDTVSAGGGDDLIEASLIGSGGINHFDGGPGNDTLAATTGGLIIRFSGLAGIETITANGYSRVVLQGCDDGIVIDVSSTTLVGIDLLTGGNGQDTIVGSANADRLSGGGGSDSISAGAGDDLIFATYGPDSDWVDGGSGQDTITAPAAQVAIGLRSISGVEAISSGGFADVSIVGSASNDSLDFSAVALSGITLIDARGGNDAITGSAGDDTIDGDQGNDSLAGGAGNDVIAGGVGDDDLSGTDGDDTFRVGLAEGYDSVMGGLGADTVTATAANVVIGLRGLSGVEAISSGGFSGVKIVGSVVPDTLDFSGVTLAGITEIDGGSGDDTLTGSSGEDTLRGSAGNDLFRVVFASASQGGGAAPDAVDGGEGVDEIRAIADYATIRLKSVAGVEVISSGGFTGVGIAGSDFGDTLDFSAVTLAGITWISGGSGNDTVWGSAGADTIYGSVGSDQLGGGGGGDQLSSGAGPVGQDSDTLIGGAGNDTLNGADAADVYIFGPGHGADRIIEPNYLGGSYTDVVHFESGIAPADIVVSRVGASLWLTHVNGTDKVEVYQFFANTDLRQAIERVEFADGTVWTREQLVLWAPPQGTSGNDALLGTDFSDDVLNGQGGNDTLNGGAGNDTEVGGAGNDVLQGNAGLDRFEGGDGIDTLDMTYVSGATVDLSLQQTFPGTGGAEVVIGVENVTGGSGADRFIGDAVANKLVGGSGADTLQGGAGNDTLTGGSGADRFVYTSVADAPVGSGPELITDFAAGSDKIDLTGIDADSANGGDQAFTWIGTAAFSSVAGQLRYETTPTGARTVYGDVGGDGVADFQIQLTGSATLAATDFLL